MSAIVNLSIEQVGSRLYVSGNSYPVKDRLKSVGCHWDGERKQWWIGTAKREVIEGVLSGNVPAEESQATPQAEDLAQKPCTGKAEYKGRTYFIIGFSARTQKYWLTVMDCSMNFWAPAGECKIVKRYEARQVRGQRIPQTIAGIRRFIEQQKNPSTARVQCPECDSWHNANERCRDCGGC